MTEKQPDSPEVPESSDIEPHNGSLRQRAGDLWRRMRPMLLRFAGTCGGLLFLFVVVSGTAMWYTSRPDFCRSCHIMEPYFVSWQESSHKDVACVKCHFPPGFGEKLWGKTLGMVQLAKYVTQTEGPRPVAEIPDESCLRSGCHETRLLSGRVQFHGIAFDHQPHLEKLRRGKKLRCTSCHSQIVQGQHMAVTTSTCFLCHFKEGFFNEGLGACTRCHEIPETEFDLGGGAIFTHDVAYEKGVDCANCHGDLIRGDGAVPRERCAVCHNRVDDLEKIDDHVFVHQKHVTEHKVDCLDCHLEIEHSLQEDKLERAAANCNTCHPGHHHEQVDMLRGMGGKSIPAMRAGMLATRVECRSCHQTREVSTTGTVLWRASADVCTKCHDAAATERLRAYYEGLESALSPLDAGVEQVRQALEAGQLDADRATAIRVQLAEMQHDIDFLQTANGVHNIHYASALIREVLQRLGALCDELSVEKPDITLPEASEEFK